jgi:hypothetical protein
MLDELITAVNLTLELSTPITDYSHLENCLAERQGYRFSYTTERILVSFGVWREAALKIVKCI